MLTDKLSVAVCVISVEYMLFKKSMQIDYQHASLAFSHLLLKNMYFVIKKMILILK